MIVMMMVIKIGMIMMVMMVVMVVGEVMRIRKTPPAPFFRPAFEGALCGYALLPL